MTTEFSTELLSSPSSGGGGGAEHHFDVKRMLRLRGPLMLGVALALAIPSVIAVWFLTPLDYEASVQLRFLAATQKVMYSNSDSATNVPYNMYLNTQVSLITGPTILMKVLDDPAVAALPIIKKQIDPLTFLEEKVTAWSKSGNELVTVTCRMQDPKAAQLIVEKVIDQYMAYASSDAAQAESDRLSILGKERDARQVEINRIRQQIVDLTRQVGMPLPSMPQAPGPSDTESFYQMLAGAMEDQSKADAEIQQAEEQQSQVERVQADFDADPAKPLFSLGIEEQVAADPRVAQLQASVGQAEASLALMQTNQVATSPQVVAAEKKLAPLKRQLVQTQQQVRKEILTAMASKAADDVAMAQRKKDDAEQRRKMADDRIEEHKKQALDASSSFAQLEELKAREEEMNELLREVRSEINRITMESKAPARVRQASQAFVPAKPNTKKRLQLMLMAVVGSCVVGGGLGFVRELTDQQIRSAKDVSTLTSLPLIAAIPHSEEERLHGPKNAPLLMADHPTSTSAEEFRRILARIIYPPESSVEINSCLVASPMPRDGKTSLACNLAIALSQAKRRVLLIDINARDHALEKSFDLDPAPGLAEILSHQKAPENVIRETSYPGLFVLGSGHVPGAMLGKLASRDMVDFLQLAEEEFEHVIIDSPPALLMSDAKLLAPVVDGVVVVVGAGVSTRGMIQRYLRELEQVGANVIGMVLNGMRATRGGYLKSNLKMYYGYSEAPTNGNGTAEDLPEMIIVDEDAAGDSVTMLVEYDDESHDATTDHEETKA